MTDATVTATPMDVATLLGESAAFRGDAPALELAGSQTVSYRQLHERVQRIASGLGSAIATQGQRRPRIGIVLPNGRTMAVALLGASSVGAALPFNPAYTLPEFEGYLAETGIDLLLTSQDYAGPAAAAAERLGLRCLQISEDGELVGLDSASGAVAQPEPDDVALVLLTSGSTGRAKAVPLTHRNICTSAAEVCRSMGLDVEDRCLSMWEQYHIGGLVDLLLAPILSGGSIICTGGFDAAGFYRLLDLARPTWFQAVPTTLNELVFHARRHPGSAQPNTLRLIRSVAAALQPRLMADVENLFGVPVIQTFGMTEAGPLITSTRLPPAVRKPGSTGQSWGTQIRVVDSGGESCAPGTVGELVIRGENVFSGYENNPAANSAQFRDGWFHTGDIGYLDPEGDLFLTGRIRQLINRGGEKVNPQDVDDALLAIPAILDAAAFAVKHPTLGEDVAAAVVVDSKDAPSEAEIRALLSARLAPFKIPNRIIFLERLPRNAVGKTDRLALSQQAEAVLAHPATRTAPRNNLEFAIAGVWKSELGVASVGIDDDFAALGGDFLSSLRIIMVLEAMLKVDILGDAAARSTTVRSMAERLAEIGCDVDGKWTDEPPA